MRQAIRMAALAAAMWLLAPVAQAQRVEGTRASAQGVYEAEVPVANQTAAARSNGFARALVQVLNKLSGENNSNARPGVGNELRRANTYVRSYDYRQDEAVSPSTGAPTFGTTLVVRFDEAKVDRMVSELGLAYWPRPRPKPVLWLAIDDGSGPRLVGLPQAAAARAVLDRAKQRGYALGLPAGSAAEQAAAGAIWRGDTSAIARLSSRYSPPMQLLGKLYRAGSGWNSDWVFVDGGRVLSKWSKSSTDARAAMASGADGAADALIRKYGRKAKAATSPPGDFNMTFTGIDSGDDYLRLAGYLQRLDVVKRLTPLRATPGAYVVRVSLNTGMAGFRRAIDQSVLAEDGDAEGEGASFRLL